MASVNLKMASVKFFEKFLAIIYYYVRVWTWHEWSLTEMVADVSGYLSHELSSAQQVNKIKV